MNNQPIAGSKWTYDRFTIQVIEKENIKNINSDGSHKRSGNVIYEYIQGPIGKIGHCKTLEGFYCMWKPLSTNIISSQ
tara:strand:+ start:1497 stop:1730 length:234 start_codon:yes stop_codon:yes gene_type:complete